MVTEKEPAYVCIQECSIASVIFIIKSIKSNIILIIKDNYFTSICKISLRNLKIVNP